MIKLCVAALRALQKGRDGEGPLLESELRPAGERVLYDAFHDALTGLPNRGLFIDHLNHAIERSKRRPNYLFAVLFLDIDRFKVINNSLGHTVGDQLITVIARRLKESLRPSDTLARFAGDKFTILLEGIRGVHDAIRVADRIQRGLGPPFRLGDDEIFATASIGIVPSTVGYQESVEFLRDAETAMYRAKAQGRACYQLSDSQMHARAVSLLQIETDLRRAVEHHHFVVHYQPIVSLQTNRLVGMETLIRWPHPQRGLLPPADFLHLLEEMGLIILVDRWVLRQACVQMRQWQERLSANEPLTVNVNFSRLHFSNPGIVQLIDQVLQETRLHPSSLNVEISESGIMENIDSAEQLLSQLKARQVGLCIDDFGTGHSSLNYLHRFPIDTLKVDRAFVSNIVKGREDLQIVRTIISLAHNLGIKVIAEGIETAEQADLLKELECEYGQGYLFSRPVDAKEAEKLLGKGTSPWRR